MIAVGGSADRTFKNFAASGNCSNGLFGVISGIPEIRRPDPKAHEFFENELSKSPRWVQRCSVAQLNAQVILR
jgi:hypothetical protein